MNPSPRPSEVTRAYTFEIQNVLRVIPQELQAFVTPNGSITLSVRPEFHDPVQNVVQTNLMELQAACPSLFARPVSPAENFAIALPCEEVKTPFKIVEEPSVGSPAFPFIEPVTFPEGSAPAEAPAGGRTAQMAAATHEVALASESVIEASAAENGGMGSRTSIFLNAIRDGVNPSPGNPGESSPGDEGSSFSPGDGERPVEPASQAPPRSLEEGDTVGFPLVTLLSHLREGVLPFAVTELPADWETRFSIASITSQLPSGRVIFTLGQAVEGATVEARQALHGFSGSSEQIMIPLREVFEAMPVRTQSSGLPAKPAALTPRSEDREFETLFEEPSSPSAASRVDGLEGAPMISGTGVGANSATSSLDDLEVAPAAKEEGRSAPKEETALAARHVPDFDGLGLDTDSFPDLELRAVFGTDEEFTPQRAVERTLELPGVEGVFLFPHAGQVVGRAVVEGSESLSFGDQMPGIFERVAGLASDLGFGKSEAFTLHTSFGVLSFFSHDHCCLAVLQSGKEFVPGVKEKLVLISRGTATLLGGSSAEE